MGLHIKTSRRRTKRQSEILFSEKKKTWPSDKKPFNQKKPSDITREKKISPRSREKKNTSKANAKNPPLSLSNCAMRLFHLVPHDSEVTCLSTEDTRAVLRQMHRKLLDMFDHPAHTDAFHFFGNFLRHRPLNLDLSDWINVWSFYAYFDEAPELAVSDVVLRYGRAWTPEESAREYNTQLTDDDKDELRRWIKPRVHFLRQLVAVRVPNDVAAWMQKVVSWDGANITQETFTHVAECLSEVQLIQILPRARGSQLATLTACLAQQQERRAHIVSQLDLTSSLYIKPLQQMVLAYLDHAVPTRKHARDSNEEDDREKAK